MICLTPLARVTKPNCPGGVGRPGLGVPVAGVQVVAQAPVQVGLPPFLSFEYV